MLWNFFVIAVYFLVFLHRLFQTLVKVYVKGGSHGVDIGKTDEQGGLWDQRLTGCQTQGAATQMDVFVFFHLISFVITELR